MKKLFPGLVFFFILSSLFSQGHWQDYIVKKEPGKDHYIYAENVNVRKTASLQGEVIFSLKPGDKVKLLAQTDAAIAVGQIKEYWYQIESRGKTGFVWGGLISEAAFNLDGKLILVKNLGIQKNKMELKIVDQGKIISRLEWETGPASSEQGYKLKFHEVKNFKQPPAKILSLEYFVYSEIEYGFRQIQFFTLDSQYQVKPAFSYSPGGCDPPVCGETIVLFPGESLKAHLKTKRKAYQAPMNTIYFIYHNFDTDDPNVHEYNLQQYHWNGKAFEKTE